MDFSLPGVIPAVSLVDTDWAQGRLLLLFGHKCAERDILGRTEGVIPGRELSTMCTSGCVGCTQRGATTGHIWDDHHAHITVTIGYIWEITLRLSDRCVFPYGRSGVTQREEDLLTVTPLRS